MDINKKSLIRKIFLSSLLVCISVLAVVAVVKAASDLIPPGAPNPAVGTMKTLEDIYQRLVAGTVAGSHTLSPSAGPAGTMHTLTDIYSAIPGGPGTTVTATTSSGTAIPAGCYSGTPKCMVGLTAGAGTAAADAQVLSGYYAYTSTGATLTGSAQGPLTWLTGSFLSLCWDNTTGPTCTIANGMLVSATGDTNNPLGAVEYCKYLNLAGVMQSTIQNIWRLPTESELLASLSDQFVISPAVQTGFVDDTYYWSGSPYDSTNAWFAFYGYGSVYSDFDAKTSTNSVRCVKI